jgi:hypothetical protein
MFSRHKKIFAYPEFRMDQLSYEFFFTPPSCIDFDSWGSQWSILSLLLRVVEEPSNTFTPHRKKTTPHNGCPPPAEAGL